MSQKPELTGIELLRYAVQLFNACSETIGQQYSAEQLLTIARAQRESAWDIYPDNWTPLQLHMCAHFGVAPVWEAGSSGEPRPVHAGKRVPQ